MVVLLSETYREPGWPKGWHIYRPAGYQRWRLWYRDMGNRWVWRNGSSDKAEAIRQMVKLVGGG